MILKPDCSHFPGDRPCTYHKNSGIKCDSCPHYDPVRQRILIIKFDALGDVLRTTALLPSLKRQYPAAHVTWLTKKGARDLFINNPFVHEVLTCEDPTTIAQLQSQSYDILIHPDASPGSAAYATLARAKIKRGFGLNDLGKVYPFNSDAEEWFEMGAFDDLKKKNTKTYQKIIHEIAGLQDSNSEIVVNLTENEKARAQAFAQKHGLYRYDFVVGLNTGAGGRWKYKKWTLEGYRDLLAALRKQYRCGILLYGGPEEQERNRALISTFPDALDTGTDNSLRVFFALVGLSDIFVTGDTMALHVATALRKKVVCLFGPTSANEIEDYGRIIKIQPDMSCLVCYKMDCDFVPHCMGSISSDMVMRAIDRHVQTIQANGKALAPPA